MIECRKKPNAAKRAEIYAQAADLIDMQTFACHAIEGAMGMRVNSFPKDWHKWFPEFMLFKETNVSVYHAWLSVDGIKIRYENQIRKLVLTFAHHIALSKVKKTKK